MRAALVALLLLASGPARAAAPLDVQDPTPRAVRVEVESSSSLAVVGQSFGPAFPASYSASGGTGTLVISAETHASMRAGSLQPVPGSFTPITIQIDLGTLQATSQPASGQLASGPISLAFTQNALGTTTLGGFIGPTQPPLFCTSQQQVDSLCQFVPSFCGETCTLVPGSAYAPATGKLNLIGSETQSGCDGGLCDGPFTFFTPRGDLRLTEAPVVPALPDSGGPALFLLLNLVALAGFAGRAGRAVTGSASGPSARERADLPRRAPRRAAATSAPE